MKLRDDLLVKFKHDVDKILYKIINIQKETNEICSEAKKLLEEFYTLIDEEEKD